MTSTASPLRRRSVLRGTMLGATLPVVATLAACSSRSPESSSPVATRPASPRVLLVYFSRPGENYYYGDRIDLTVGNTEVLAAAIARGLRDAGWEHAVHRIEAVDAYPHDYEETVARNVREQDADARPEIANMLDSIDNFDVVLIGSPIWNVRPPRIMLTFADAHDFTGKTVHPFTTHAMSGLGNAEREYRTACSGAEIGEGLAVRGEQVRQDGPGAVERWLTSIGLI